MIYNNLQEICNRLEMRFPVSQISKNLGYSKGIISEYYNDKKELSENFKKQFEEYYDIKFKDFINKNPLTNSVEVKKNNKKDNFFTPELIDELFRSDYFKGRLATFVSERLNTDNDNVEKYRSELKDLLKIIKKEKV